MSKDVLGYERTVQASGGVLSAEAAVFMFGNQLISLMQQVQTSYQQKVTPKYEAGTSNLYWVKGQPMGNVSASRLVGAEGLQLMKEAGGDICKLKTLQVSFDGAQPCVNLSDKLSFNNAVVQSVGLSYSVGGNEVSETITLLVAGMELVGSFGGASPSVEDLETGFGRS